MDGRAGIGETYPSNLLSVQIQKNKGVLVIVASSGIVALLLNDDPIADSILKLPLN